MRFSGGAGLALDLGQEVDGEAEGDQRGFVGFLDGAENGEISARIKMGLGPFLRRFGGKGVDAFPGLKFSIAQGPAFYPLLLRFHIFCTVILSCA